MSISSYGRDVVLVTKPSRFAGRSWLGLGDNMRGLLRSSRRKQQAMCHLAKPLISRLLRIHSGTIPSTSVDGMSEPEHPPARSANGMSRSSEMKLSKCLARSCENGQGNPHPRRCLQRAREVRLKLKSFNRNIVLAESIADLARREIEQTRGLGLHPPCRLHGLKQTLLFSLDLTIHDAAIACLRARVGRDDITVQRRREFLRSGDWRRGVGRACESRHLARGSIGRSRHPGRSLPEG